MHERSTSAPGLARSASGTDAPSSARVAGVPGIAHRFAAPTSGGLSTGELALLLLALVACRLLAIRACPIYDDAFITYRYARNLALGGGMVFNPGASWEPVLGTTTPLYGWILSWFARAGLDLVHVSRALNVACDVGSALLIARALGRSRVAATVALVGFAALPPLARISVGGMESPLFALLALGAAAAFHARRYGWAGILAALDCAVRPEGVLLVGILALLALRDPRALLRFLVPVAAIGLATIAVLNREYGFPVPQSVLAKSHMKAGAWERVLPILQQSFAPLGVGALALPLVAWGYARVVRARGAAMPFALFALAIGASYLAARPHVWGWYFYVPLCGWVIALGAGVERAHERWRASRAAWSRTLLAPRALAPLAIALATCAALVRPSPIPENVYEPLQAWARETSRREPLARVLASDIGAIGWAWEGTVLDSEGLTWPAALDYPHPNAIIRACEPEYLLVVAERDRVGPIVSDGEILARYEPIERFSPSGARSLSPALEELPPAWAQDYLVYRRRARSPERERVAPAPK
jgi:hypothetical protein